MKKPAAKKTAAKKTAAKKPAAKKTAAKRVKSAKLDLAKYTPAQLKKMKAQIDKELASGEKSKLRDAYNEMQKVAQKYRTTFDEVVKFSRSTKRKKGKKTVGKPKYRNPENKQQTWTGRGKPPGWLEAAERKGITREQMEIK